MRTVEPEMNPKVTENTDKEEDWIVVCGTGRRRRQQLDLCGCWNESAKKCCIQSCEHSTVRSKNGHKIIEHDCDDRDDCKSDQEESELPFEQARGVETSKQGWPLRPATGMPPMAFGSDAEFPKIEAIAKDKQANKKMQRAKKWKRE